MPFHFFFRSLRSCRRTLIVSQLKRFATSASPRSLVTVCVQVQQLAVMEELKQQMLQRQQQAEVLTVELKAVRGERYICAEYATVFR
jgi:hypothetical protein